MLFRQLEYFVAVARERHFAHASAACHVSQPALSAGISKLEQELNVSLINRGHAFEGLTPEGELLVMWAKRIVAERDALKAEVHALKSGVTGVLRLGVVPSASTTVALPVAAFCAAHPLVKVQIKSGLSSTEIARRLHDFELDAGVTYVDASDDPGLDVVPLYEERYVLIASEMLIPDISTSMSWVQASRLPLAVLTTKMRSRQVIDAAFERNHVQLVPQVETDSIASLHAHMRTGRWASIVPHTWVQTITPPARTRIVPLVDPVATARVVVAISAASPGSVIARAFAAVAAKLSLGELFDQRLGELFNQELSAGFSATTAPTAPTLR
ncbi:LysR family transcriptional regulator [Cryobacterium lyxosi]|uniref:LysR family transcriptional regulator n=1 Tax=Cryobacterium lyxosi TaxID=1259228 RepID=A0A4R8ZGB9_9MICO|nr:LysR family transcriptional regulator [Cryobacterium lyxosi]TFD27257.1 LysR family transcriptional regulator [Cryobacterium lyxosi]